jgi:hypothetical protein
MRQTALAALSLLFVVGVISPLAAQDPRDTLVARAFNEFDTGRRLQLLNAALDPSAGPPSGAWPVGVQLMAQTQMEEGNDSLAGLYLRWAVRRSPGFQVDTVQFLPEVATAYTSAEEFVRGSRSASDSLVGTSWIWPQAGNAEKSGRLQVSAPSVGPAFRATAEGVGILSTGTPVELAPGSYRISGVATGYDSLAVTREVLPGVTTVLEFRPRRSAVAAAEPAVPAAIGEVGAEPQKKKKFPFALVLGGVVAAGAVVALASGGGDNPPNPTTGGITLTFPNP